jgi:hypothetical protein
MKSLRMWMLPSIICLFVDPIQSSGQDKLSLKNLEAERIDSFVGELASRSITLDASYREKIVDYGLRPELSDGHRQQLVMALFLSLKEVPDRAKEAAKYTERLKVIASLPQESKQPIFCLPCIAFSFEDQDVGLQLEISAFRRISVEPSERQADFINSLAYTRWLDPEARLERLRKVYGNDSASDITREAVINTVCQGILTEDLPIANGLAFFRDIAKQNSHTKRANDLMFQRIVELAVRGRLRK